MGAAIAINIPVNNPQINAQQQATITIDATVTVNDGTLHSDCEAYVWHGQAANDPGATWPGLQGGGNDPVLMSRDINNAAHWTSMPYMTGLNGNFLSRVWVRFKGTGGNASGAYSVINGM